MIYKHSEEWHYRDPWADVTRKSRQAEIVEELSRKYGRPEYCFSFTADKEKIKEEILHSEYISSVQTTLYFYIQDSWN